MTAFYSAGAVAFLVALLAYLLSWVVIDARERRAEREHRQAMADSAVRAHRERQDRGRYLTDDTERPE